MPDRRVHLPHRLLADIGQDERLVVHLGDRLLAHYPQHRGRWILTDLSIDRSQYRVLIHHDLVRSQRDQRAARHGIVRNEDRHLPAMAHQRRCDLLRGQDETTRRVDDEIDGHVVRGQPNGPQHGLRVVDVDVARQWNA
ncbi:MAG: hypothetical protein N2Z82_05100 [Thermomicrobium sp.]|nr:hypothetical protein [Thermomicrobium sp.]